MISIGAGRALTLSGGSILLGSWGRLEVKGTSVACVETACGQDVELPSDVAQNLGTIFFWLDDADGLLLLIPRVGDVILLVDLRVGTVSELEWLVRDEDEDLRFASVRPGPARTLFVLYERGLVYLEADGSVFWHTLHDDLSADIVAIDTGNWSGASLNRSAFLRSGY
jgi:hypothetical protein